MLHSLSLEELRELPPAKLPREIPQEVLRGVTGERREILDELLFEANSHHVSERLALEQVFGPDLMKALDQAKLAPEAAVKESLKRHIESVEKLAEQYLAEPNPALKEALDREFAELDVEVKQSYRDKMEMQGFQKMLNDGFHLAGQYQPEFKDALASMRQQEQVFDTWLGRYYRTRLQLVARAMDERRGDVKKKNDKLKNIYWEIKEIRKRIQSSSEAMGLSPGEANNNHFIQELRSDLQMLESMKPDYDVMIPEADLTQWMDLIIDAYLCPIDPELMAEPMAVTRTALFELLLKYCEVQSQAAEQIAEQEFSVLDKDKNIKYMLETERFVQKYFKQKDIDVKGWGTDESSLDKLNQFEHEVLDEIRANTHFQSV